MISTLEPIYEPLMFIGEKTYVSDHCLICGRRYPLNNHHIIKRSQGCIYTTDEKPMPKPMITLCGVGNNLSYDNGRPYCHGLAHHQRLHFKVVNGELFYIILPEPTKYTEALDRAGWRKVNRDC